MTAEEFWKETFPDMVDEAGVCEFAENYTSELQYTLASLREELAVVKRQFEVLTVGFDRLVAEVASLTKERDELRQENESLLSDIDHGWELLGMPDYEGEDDIGSFIARLRSRAEKAESRVESLEKALKEIADPVYHSTATAIARKALFDTSDSGKL